MSTYNPYAARARHRRARVRQEMSAKEYMGCMGIAALTILALFVAALI